MMSGAGEASSRWRRRRWDADSAAAAGVNAIPEMPSSSSGVTSSSLLSNALASGGGGTGGSELASAAVQSAPLTIQLLIPLLMLLVLFGFISLFAYALATSAADAAVPRGRRGRTARASPDALGRYSGQREQKPFRLVSPPRLLIQHELEHEAERGPDLVGHPVAPPLLHGAAV